jgi:hypothetical protein
MKFFTYLTLIFFLSSCQGIHKRVPASDDIFWNIIPKREITEVHHGSVGEEVVRLKNARVMLVDYDLVRRDFPGIAHLSNPEIDQWLLDSLAYVSIPQKNQTAVNSAIETTGETIQAHRPPHYGRAMVFDMKTPTSGQHLGLMDVKGVGSLRPRQADHGNGVATLGESIREFIYENMMRRVLKNSGVPQKTVGSYAVIDPGFDVVHADGSKSPAGFYVRQAHDRVVDHPGAWLPSNLRSQLQTVFRTYGIDPNENIQGTKLHDGIFDFGHFVVRDDLPTINPNLQIPFEQWGYDKSIRANSGDRWFYSKKDNPWNWSHQLAEDWRTGQANRDSAWNHFLNMLGPVERKLRTGIGGNSTCQQLVDRLLGI